MLQSFLVGLQFIESIGFPTRLFFFSLSVLSISFIQICRYRFRYSSSCTIRTLLVYLPSRSRPCTKDKSIYARQFLLIYSLFIGAVALEAVGVTADSRSIRDSSAIDSGNSVRTLGVAISPTQSPTLCALVRYGSDQMVFKTSLHQQPRTTNYEAPKKIWSAAIPIDGFLRACS